MLTNNIEILKKILEKSIRSVRPYNLIKTNVELVGRHLRIQSTSFEIGKPLHVVGFGKAVQGMAVALEETLGNQLQMGIVSIPHSTPLMFPEFPPNSKIQFYEGAQNNLPDNDALKTAIKIKDHVGNLGEDDTVIVLISGGGSALLPLPKGRITLQEKFELVKNLGNRGANINELNCVRKQISELKGGGLAKFCHPARVITIILSDVIGDPLDVIASGTTVLNPENQNSAIEILEKYSLYENLTESIKEVLNQTENVDSNHFKNVHNFIIGNNKIALCAAKEKSEELGLKTFIVSTEIQGDVEEIADKYMNLTHHFLTNTSEGEISKFLTSNFEVYNDSSLMKSLENFPFTRNEDVCLILGGEPTVSVTGDGTGGRNQQLALSFSLKLKDSNIDNVYFLSCGTDGIDGPTDAAGAIGYSALSKDSSTLKPESFLENNDCYNFFRIFKDGECLIKTGSTGTNVMDIHIILIRKEEEHQ